MEWLRNITCPNMMEIEQNHMMAQHYIPCFWMHSEEEYQSMDINRFMSYCVERTPGDLRINCSEHIVYANQDKSTLQVLYNIVSHLDENSERVTDVVYCLFFPHSESRRNSCFRCFSRQSVYMPRVTIRFRGARSMLSYDSTPWMILMSMHDKHRWYEWTSDDLDIHSHRLQVYISKNTHACYAKAGKHSWCMSSDVCEKGYTATNVCMTPFYRLNPIFSYKTVICDGFNWCDKTLEFGDYSTY